MKRESLRKSQDSSSDDDSSKGRIKSGKTEKERGKRKLNEKLLDNLAIACLSVCFRDKRVKLTDDRFSATGHRGYTTVLGTHAATRGKWYFEVTVVDLNNKEGHVRLGWSTRRSRYDMPIGSDIFSFAIRDECGEKVVQGCRFRYADVSVKEGDIVGCYLTLPDDGMNNVSIDYEDPTWTPGLLCDPQYPPIPSILPNSEIEWSINGQRFGKAFTNLVEGAYYPAISLFMKAKVDANFGPSFSNQPENGFRAVAELFDPHSHLKPARRPPTFLPRGYLAEQQQRQ